MSNLPPASPRFFELIPVKLRDMTKRHKVFEKHLWAACGITSESSSHDRASFASMLALLLEYELVLRSPCWILPKLQVNGRTWEYSYVLPPVAQTPSLAGDAGA